MDGVIFDLNDCIVQRPDYPATVREAVANVLKRHYKRTAVPDHLLSDAWLVEHSGNKKNLFNYLLYHAGILSSARAELVEECRDEYYKLRDLSHAKKFPDTIFLEKISSPIGIVSNSSRETVDEILSLTRLHKLVEPDNVFANGGKSHVMAEAKQTMGDNIIYVGDTPEDICLGKQHNFFTVAIARNLLPTSKLMRARPNLILRSLAALPNLAKNGVEAYSAN